MTAHAWPVAVSHRVGENDLLGLAATGKVFSAGSDATFNPYAGAFEFSGSADNKIAMQWQTSHQPSMRFRHEQRRTDQIHIRQT